MVALRRCRSAGMARRGPHTVCSLSAVVSRTAPVVAAVRASVVLCLLASLASGECRVVLNGTPIVMCLPEAGVCGRCVIATSSVFRKSRRGRPRRAPLHPRGAPVRSPLEGLFEGLFVVGGCLRAPSNCIFLVNTLRDFSEGLFVVGRPP